VTWNQPGCRGPPAPGKPSVRGIGQHPGTRPRNEGAVGRRRLPGQQLDVGTVTPSSNAPQAPAWAGFGSVPAPGSGTPQPRPPPAFYSLPPSRSSPAPRRGLSARPTDDSPGIGFALCWEDARAQRQSVSSPLSKNPPREGGHGNRPPPSATVHQPLRNVAAEAEGHEIKGRETGLVVPTSLGVASVSVSPPVAREDALPAGSAVSPWEVLRCPQYTHRSGNFISYTGMEWFWGWP